MLLTTNNWDDFQHYKHRSPPWIKLHKRLLDNMIYQRLPVASKALAPMLWLLASESEDGSINLTIEEIAFRLRMLEKDVIEAIKPLIEYGFFTDASNVLSECLSDATTEKRRVEKSRVDTNEKQSPKKKPIPDDFQISERVQTWAIKNNHRHLEKHFEYFVDKCKQKGYTNVDWDLAFMNAIRENWAKIDDKVEYDPFKGAI